MISEVIKKFSNSPYDSKELVSIGLIGLIKSVDTFDTTKEILFATYSKRCIENEILMFMRKEKKYINVANLEQPIATDEEGKELKVEDTLMDINSDFVSEYENNNSYKVIRKVVNALPERNKNIILKYFGFEGNNPMTQREIADELGLSRPYISKTIKRVLKDISVQLKALEIIEVPFQQKSADKKSTEGVKKMSKRLQTIYEYFDPYTRKQVDEMLSKLTEKERTLVTLRYGSDLDNPVTSKEWDQKKRDHYYSNLVPKMKKLLANPNYVFRTKKAKVNAKTSSQETLSIKPEQPKIRYQIPSDQDNHIEYISKSFTQENHEKSTLVKEDYIRIMELLKTSSFGQMLNILTPKEAIIVCLRLGYVDDKYFSSDSIAEFLGIELDEVIKSTKKALLLYKDSINEFIDKTVEHILDDQNPKSY